MSVLALALGLHSQDLGVGRPAENVHTPTPAPANDRKAGRNGKTVTQGFLFCSYCMPATGPGEKRIFAFLHFVV